MSNNDALREALERLLTWPNPNGTIEQAYIPGWLAKQCREAIAASKPEPRKVPLELMRFGGRCEKHLSVKPCGQCAAEMASKTEQQAQAGEP